MKITETSDRFLTRVIYGGGLAVSVFLLLLGWTVYRVQQTARASIQSAMRIEGNLSHVLFFDMVLFGFAQTAVNTGEPQWESRHAATQPLLKQNLDEMRSLPGPEKDALLPEIESAGGGLRELEREVFALVRAGHKKRAGDLLYGEGYAQGRERHYKLIDQLGEAIKRYEEALLEQGRRQLYKSFIILLFAFPVLFLCGYTLYHLLAILYERIERLVLTDELTQLYNRRFLYQELAKEAERSKRYDDRFSIVMTDVDHFKKINDTYGHHVGDVVLKRLAQSMRASFRPIDFACRFGGEEFVVILPRTTGADAMAFAERIRGELAAKPLRVSDKLDLPVTVSIGVSEYVKGEDLDRVLNRADQGLYQAKGAGRNRCVYVEPKEGK